MNISGIKGAKNMKTVSSFLMILLICAFPQTSIKGAQDGLLTCFKTVIPSLFPFFVVSKMFIKSGGAYVCGKIFGPFTKFMFKINPNGASPFVIGIVSGYPVGAITVCDLYKENEISKDEAQNLLGFCNNSGPSFLIGAIGASLLKSRKIGYIIYIIHILSAISVGVFLRHNIKKQGYMMQKKSIKKSANIFTDSVEESVASILSVCGYITFFAVVIEFISISCDSVLITGFFEMTTAVKNLCIKPLVPLSTKIIIISVLCAFASLSVNMQVKRVISKTDLSFKKYFFAKCLQAAFAFIYSFLYVMLFPNSLQVFSLGTAQIYSDNSPSFAACAVIFVWYIFKKLKNTKNFRSVFH